MSKYIVCKCCNVKFDPINGSFHTLCDPCFSNFDTQKMNGRYAPLFLGYWIPYFEKSDDYVTSGRCQHIMLENRYPMAHEITGYTIKSYISKISNQQNPLE